MYIYIYIYIKTELNGEATSLTSLTPTGIEPIDIKSSKSIYIFFESFPQMCFEGKWFQNRLRPDGK